MNHWQTVDIVMCYKQYIHTMGSGAMLEIDGSLLNMNPILRPTFGYFHPGMCIALIPVLVDVTTQ